MVGAGGQDEKEGGGEERGDGKVYKREFLEGWLSEEEDVIRCPRSLMAREPRPSPARGIPDRPESQKREGNGERRRGSEGVRQRGELRRAGRRGDDLTEKTGGR
jgi:hypothetical protein